MVMRTVLILLLSQTVLQWIILFVFHTWLIDWTEASWARAQREQHSAEPTLSALLSGLAGWLTGSKVRHRPPNPSGGNQVISRAQPQARVWGGLQTQEIQHSSTKRMTSRNSPACSTKARLITAISSLHNWKWVSSIKRSQLPPLATRLAHQQCLLLCSPFPSYAHSLSAFSMGHYFLFSD